ncbi:MAG TPA: NfeD family protein [Actinomycetota bacterium]|nr:NfeD family protein [Actinomycetota bacterium]
MSLLIGGTLALLFLPTSWAIGVIAGLAAFEGVELAFWLWLRRQRPRSGHEAMVGRHGVLIEGDRVRIAGTTYPGRVLEGEPGDPVAVEGVEGMTLVVRRHEPRYEEESA